MTLRKGEVTLPQIKRKWPHHVALPADKVRGVRNSEVVWGFATTLSAAPRPYSLRGGDRCSASGSRKMRTCSASALRVSDCP